MRIIASIPAYREALFLDYAIKAVHDFVDEVIITNTAMKPSLDLGLGYESNDGTEEIIDNWRKNSGKVHVLASQQGPETFKDMMNPALSLAKELKGDWLFTVGADEVWKKQSLVPMRNILRNCEKNGIFGLNAWMYIFAPDFWNYKDFRNPRFAKITEGCQLSWGDSMRWPSFGLYQYAGDTNTPAPAGTPEKVMKANSDYPRNLRAFHYSCVGEDRVKFKAMFYQKYDGTNCDKYVDAYINKNWEEFARMGYKKFTGKHPKIMLDHVLYNQRILG